MTAKVLTGAEGGVKNIKYVFSMFFDFRPESRFSKKMTSFPKKMLWGTPKGGLGWVNAIFFEHRDSGRETNKVEKL